MKHELLGIGFFFFFVLFCFARTIKTITEIYLKNTDSYDKSKDLHHL